MPPPQRIIVVRLSALGDVVLAQAAILALRRRLPKAEITWVIDQRFRSIADAVPGIRVIPIAKPKGILEFLLLRRELRREHYDALLAMQANFRANLLYSTIRAPIKIGFDSRRARDLHRFFVNDTIERRDEHLLDGFNQFVTKLTAENQGTFPPLESLQPLWPNPPTPPAVAVWSNALSLPERYIVVHAGASKPERCWPAQRYTELARLFNTRPEIAVVLTGGQSVSEIAAARAFLAESPQARNLCGKTDFAQLSQLLRSAAVVVSPDTAAVHLARVADVPVVGLYAVARPELSGPYRQLGYTIDRYSLAVKQVAGRDPLQVDWHFRVHDSKAMALIEAEAVWSAVGRAWSDRERSGQGQA